MPDLFARLAARSRGHAVALRPRSDLVYTGGSMLINEQTVQSLAPTAGVPAAETANGHRAPAGAATDVTGPADDGIHDADRDAPDSPAVLPRNKTPATTKPVTTPAELAPPPAIARPTRRRAAPVTRGPASLAQVVAALDAGSPADTPPTPDTSPEPPPATNDRATPYVPREPDQARVAPPDNLRDARGHDIHVTIGELVIRANAPTLTLPTPPAARTTPPRLSLHDYLRGRREPT